MQLCRKSEFYLGMPVHHLKQWSCSPSIACSDTSLYLYTRKQLNLQLQSRKIWVVELLSGRTPLSLGVRLALALKSQLTAPHFDASTDLSTTFQAWGHRVVSLTPAAPNIIPDPGLLPALTHCMWNSPSPSSILSPTQTSLSFPQICTLTLQAVVQGQHHPGILYPTAYIFHPPAPDEKCKGKFLAASANLTSQGLFAQRDNNHSSSQDTISSRQGKSGSPDS